MIRFKLIVATVASFGLVCFGLAVAATQPESRAEAQKAQQNGNWKDAYAAFSALALDPKDDPAQVPADLTNAIQCLQQLGRTDEVDDFREQVIDLQKDNWRLLWAAAQSYQNVENWGFLIANKFYRGGHRGNDGRQVSSIERDRVRSLQLMVKASAAADKDKDRADVGRFYFYFADMLMNLRYGGGAWQLQTLTDLTKTPDYDEMQFGSFGRFRGNFGGGGKGAPTDEQGNPVFHKVPQSFEKAKTDGERWRWALSQAAETGADNAARSQFQFAEFLQQQFDVVSLMNFGNSGFFRNRADDKGKEAETGAWAINSLGEDETIAQLATGPKRFKLADEFNFIKIYSNLSETIKGGFGEQAGDALPQLFEDRQQYDRSATLWARQIGAYGPGPNGWRQSKLEQILGNWGMFEPIQTQAAGKELELPFIFRNAKKVSFTAWSLDVKKLLDDVKQYLRSKPAQLDWQSMNIDNIGWRIVQQGQAQYRKDKVAGWAVDLDPREKHFDKRISLKCPIKDAGAYLIEANAENGNTTRIVAWIADTVIVKKAVDKGSMCFVTDAVTGAPLEKASVEYFGWRQRHLGDNRWTVDVNEFKQATDADGVTRAEGQQDPNGTFQYIITADGEKGRFAYQGFTGIWAGSYADADSPYNQRKVFTITDRPVYRPAQNVKFKFWVGQAKYDQEGKSVYAGQNFPVVVLSPRGDKIFEKNFVADEYGGFDGEISLEKEATPGIYQLTILNMGGGSFRVEEYKKPEFEVSIDAPTEPVMLGEKITATIKGKYYFGAPVVNATVRYKVLRSEQDARWFPSARWDWMYERGYWWFAPNRPWFPGFARWGCEAPYASWYGHASAPPELVLQNDVPIGKDGTVKVEIDTSIAKALHGDQDHKYEITAEVIDESRRTIVGSGRVTVAREPFKVYAWSDRGYYQAGDAIEASLQAQTLDQKPVKGKGELKLLQITYDEKQKPVETEVQKWDLSTGDDGAARMQMKAAKPGQYRLSYVVTDDKKHAVEGGYIFIVRGDAFTGTDFRFNNLEIIADKKEYAPGEKVRLMINTDRKDGTVALFLRPVNGMYVPPKIIRLNGKSTVEEFEITKKDMPNIFVEAVTVSDGKVYEETKEIVVPPEKRVVDVKVLPSQEKYKPGEKGKVRIQLTDANGEPIAASAVVSMYDKSVDYISGGSNVPDIKAFFWKWRRAHSPQTESSLYRYAQPIYRNGETPMGFIGRFGFMVANDADGDGVVEEAAAGMGGKPGMGFGAFSRRGGMAQGGGRDSLRKGGALSDLQAGAAAPTSASAADGAAYRQIAKVEKRSAQNGAEADEMNGADAGGGDALVDPTTRKNFADTAYWAGLVSTDKTGIAEINLDMPENLTTWRTKVWAMGSGTRVGEGSADVVTYKNLIIRLQAPRFFTQKDEVVLSANVHNYLKSKKKISVELTLHGNDLAAVDPQLIKQVIEVDAEGEKRVDWTVKVLNPGQATVKMAALTNEESDAMQMSFPVYIHGMLKTESYSGAMRPEDSSASFGIRIPAERLPEQSRIEIRYSPSVAAAMVDALPYLADYPYGCTEQTLNRFLPSVITEKTLLSMGLNLADIGKKRVNLNAQEIGDDPKRAEDWKRKQAEDYNPVFDEAKLGSMVKEGITKLSNQQLADGGWGWFSGFGEQSWPHTTSVVVHGLQVARACDVKLPDGMLERGVQWLQRYQAQQVALIKNWPNIDSKQFADDMDAFVYMILADDKGPQDANANDMREFLYRDRTHLAVYSLAVYGLALEEQHQADKLRMIMENIRQFVVEDNENQTAYLKLPESNYWWYWYGSDTEADAWYLKLLSKVDPKGQVASRLSKYIINNRKHATYWNGTRDTAYSIEALSEFIKASGEDKPDETVTVILDGKKLKEVKINADNFFSFDNKVVLEGKDVPTGEHKIEFAKAGKGALYFNAYVTNFTLEDPIKKAGLEIKVQRKFYKLVQDKDASVKVAGSHGQAADQKIEKYIRQELKDGDTLKSGDIVEAELEIDSKNDYEYILFEDMKAAGFEAMDTQSGYNGNDLNAYMELRDERVCFFARTLARGKHSVSYKLRAEIPGKFSAMPTKASAMYAPELKANSDENKLNIVD